MTSHNAARCILVISLILLFGSNRTAAQTPEWGPTNGPYGAVCQDFIQTASGVCLVNDDRNGVWRSTDSCAHWQLSTSGLGHRQVYALAIATDGSVLAGTYSGIFRSSDEGLTWEDRSTGMTSKNTKDIVVLSDGTVLATAWSGGIYRSTNVGQLWTEANSGLTQLSIYCLRKTTADDIFAGSFGSGVFRSTDKGLSWTVLPLTGYIYDIGASPDGILYAVSNNVGVFQSSDNGDTWVKSDQGLPYLSGHGFAIRSKNEILFGVNIERGMYRSTDAGSTWSAFNAGYSLSNTQGIYCMPNGDCLAMTYGDGVYRLPKDSSHWRPRNEGMQGSWIYALQSASDSVLFAGGLGGVWVTRNQGTSWSYAHEGVGSIRVSDLLYANQTMFVAGYPGGICRSTDLGFHWSSANTGMTSNRPACLAVNGSGTLYCGSDGGGVSSSANNGNTWQPISSGLTSLRVHALCVDASASLYASTDDGVFKSTNQGTNWVLASNGLPSTQCYALCAANGFVFAGVSTGVYRSSDGGSSWAQVGVNQLPSRAHYALKIDGNGTIYAGSAGRVRSSTDNGDTWQNPGLGLPSGTVRDFGFNNTGQLFAATEGNGVYRLPALSSGSEITIRTSPEGRSFTVDGTAYNSAQMFNWQSGSTHTLGTTQTQNGASGVRYIWNDWSDGGALSHSVTAQPGAKTITATFHAEYQLTMNVNGAGSVTPQTGWHTPGASVQIRATPDAGQTFSGWEGSGSGSYTGSNNPATVTMNGAIAQTARFMGGGTTREVTITTSPAGARVTVDGETITSSRTYSWHVGSTHTIETLSPQIGAPGIRYVWLSWSNGQAISHTWTVPAGSEMTLTATFDIEYYLTILSGAGGSVTPEASWQTSGSQVELLAIPQPGFVFDRWEGKGHNCYTGMANPITINMLNPITEEAFFKQVTAILADSPLPEAVILHQNAPNPCSQSTQFSFALPQAQRVTLVLTDLYGHEIARPVSNVVLSSGEHWRRFDVSGLATGVYLYRLETAGAVRVRTMVILK